MLAYIPDQHWYIAAFFQSRTFQHLSGGGIWEFAKHVERVLHASLECQLHKKYFTSFRGPTDCRALWWSCASFFVATEKGKTRILGLKTHSLQFLTTSRPLRFLFFFPSSPSFFLCLCWPNCFVSVTNFLNLLTQEFCSTPKIFWPYTMDFWIEENDPNSPHFKV